MAVHVRPRRTMSDEATRRPRGRKPAELCGAAFWSRRRSSSLSGRDLQSRRSSLATPMMSSGTPLPASALVGTIPKLSEHALSDVCILQGLAGMLTAKDICHVAVTDHQMREVTNKDLDFGMLSRHAQEIQEFASETSLDTSKAAARLSCNTCVHVFREHALGFRLAPHGALPMHCERDRWVSRGTSCVFAPLGGSGLERGHNCGKDSRFVGLDYGGCCWQAWLDARRVGCGHESGGRSGAILQTEWSVSVVCSSKKPLRRRQADRALYTFLSVHPQTTIEVGLVYAGRSEIDVEAISPSTPLLLAIKPLRTLCVVDGTERVIDFAAQPAAFQEQHRHAYEHSHVLEMEGKPPVDSLLESAGVNTRWHALDELGLGSEESAVFGVWLHIVGH
eukprot:TRINITY_DN38515_c0_g1_i1.p1 TRINITY_DN38515_c0_g1~~TRINITY_DN38515_c0_g1_i1.p1  ORF type:complete len:392 (+),score=36.64 TRINITY_DN38515_c0_g1_i1:72-1247(+)